MNITLLYSLLLSLGCLSAPTAVAEQGEKQLPSGAVVEHIDLQRRRDSVVVTMNIDLTAMQVGRNRSVVVSPLLYTKGESRWLPAVEVMGRRRYLYYQRNPHTAYADSLYSAVRRNDDTPQKLAYRVALPYAAWMDNALLAIAEDRCGCGEVIDTQTQEGQPAGIAISPRLAYVQPAVEPVKSRALSGEAYLDFPVNQTVIRPEYRRNATELRRIRATIDTIRTDPDYTIKGIALRGYASPEGSFEWNIRLSEGRTEALRRFLVEQYAIEPELLSTEAAAENWDGLRAYVLQSNLPDREAIVGIIDSPLAPDPKEQKLRTEHPESYARLLSDCYPGLRRTHYRIDYVVRGFSVDEARQLIGTRPQNLSLQEMFAVAQTYEPGSDDFNRVFDVAVRLYPDDPVANLNAANALLERRQAEQALPFLEKAGSSPQADNARGVAYLLLQRYDEAEACLQRAERAKLPEAEANLQYL